LRAISDTIADLRTPTVTGIYRFWTTKVGDAKNLRIIRASLMPGFDSASLLAIKTAGESRVFVPPAAEDSMWLDVRVSSDSTLGARPFIAAKFPRMPVVDAVARSGNPTAPFPEDARRDSVPSGDIVLRFVVDRTGVPAMETVELVRGLSTSFLRSALEALPKQRFAPATIQGCPVAQEIEYAFNFINPDLPPWD
jgi:outer membrane biosynthesis protein TonB